MKKVLLANPTVQAIVGDRVYRGAQDGAQARIQKAYVELRYVGGPIKTDHYQYANQRIDIYCFAPTYTQVDILDTLIYGFLDSMTGGLPLIEFMPGAAYDYSERQNPEKGGGNVIRTGLFRPFHIVYIDHYEE